MENNNIENKQDEKEELKRRQEEQKKEKKRAFTLIELLAVIIVLGVLMIVAIPAVTSYITSSRKSAYVDTAKEISNGTKTVVNEGKLGMYDTDTTYYIESGYIKTENASKSPYGEFVQAYTIVTYDGKGYTYYWTSVDDAGQGVRGIIKSDKLDEDDIESDLTPDMVDPSKTKAGIGLRSKIKLIRADGTIDDYDAEKSIPEAGGRIETSTGNGTEVATGTGTGTGSGSGTGSGTEVATGTGTGTSSGTYYPYSSGVDEDDKVATPTATH